MDGIHHNMMTHINPYLKNIYPLKFFQVMDPQKLEALGKKQSGQEEDDKEKSNQWLRCASCRNKVTNAANRIEVNGRHQHVFNNPAGHIFEIGCFAMAEGCANWGQPTLEFTWFSGFSWRFALCGKCQTHLGWLYQSLGGNCFYGLILEKLIEDSGGL